MIIQTYTPEHYSIQAAGAHDYPAFYREELAFRREMDYPPYTFLARVLVSGPVEREVIDTAQEAAEVLRTQIGALEAETDDVKAFGPSPAPLSLVRSRYRWHIVLKGKEAAVRKCLDGFVYHPQPYPCSVSVDAAPCALL